MRPGVAAVVDTLFLAAWMLALQGVASVRANPATLYVDWKTGSDRTDCTDPAGACAGNTYAAEPDTQAAVADGDTHPFMKRATRG